jgi:purine-binding chemotaxis protein CheW
MSDQERMDRAERIRRMREGHRGAEDEESSDDAAAGTPDAAASDDEVQPDETPSEPSAATNGDAAAATEPPATDETTGADAEVDDVVADAVDRISGASASLPEAAEVDPEAAASAEADAAETVDDTEAADAAAEADDEASAESADADEPAEETRVLEFTLDDEQYCLDIDYIEEIVKHEHITRVPNTPDFVEGVVDLRGQITTILNPKIPIEKDNTEPGDLIVVFDADAFDEQGYLGWVVDDVRQVSPVTDGEVNHPPMDEDYITGVIDRDEDDQFVIWTTPDLALEEAG